MKYPVAERFRSIQGEGQYTGTPMAFIRLVGCSVGQKVCTACDTNFDRMYTESGGGLYSPEDLLAWVDNMLHICITGGEPLDRDLLPLLKLCQRKTVHIETSGTVYWSRPPLRSTSLWITVSPKPKYLEAMVANADEVKVILGGLGEGSGWPTLQDALRWAQNIMRPVYIQPRNSKDAVNEAAMHEAIEAVLAHPNLRLSTQLHKYLTVR